MAADPLGCDATVYDPAGQLDAVAVGREVERTATSLGADLHVRAEPTLDTGLDARMAQLEATCPGWTVGGDRADDLVVVMYSVQAREASVFYGADQSFRLEDRWEAAVDAMGAEFRTGGYTDGVVDGLRALRSSSTSTSSRDDTSSGGSDGLPASVWLFGLLIVGVIVYSVVRYARTGEWGDGGDDEGGSSWSSTRRRRSFSSSSSSRRSSSSSSSRRSGRSGGGTKKW